MHRAPRPSAIARSNNLRFSAPMRAYRNATSAGVWFANPLQAGIAPRGLPNRSGQARLRAMEMRRWARVMPQAELSFGRVVLCGVSNAEPCRFGHVARSKASVVARGCCCALIGPSGTLRSWSVLHTGCPAHQGRVGTRPQYHRSDDPRGRRADPELTRRRRRCPALGTLVCCDTSGRDEVRQDARRRARGVPSGR